MKQEQRVENYCQRFIETGNKSEAYRAAYTNSVKWADSAINPKASNYHKSDKVQARLMELQVEHTVRHNITVDSLIGELEEARQCAMTAETPQSSAAISATMGKAKLLGLDKQVIDLTSSDGSMSPKGLGDFYAAFENE